MVCQIVADYRNACGECPVWDNRSGVLYWLDNVSSRIFYYEPEAGRHGIFYEGLPMNAFRPNRHGGFVGASREGIFLWSPGSQPKLVCKSVDGCRCQINDAVADPIGRFIAGSNFYDPSGLYELGRLFCVDNCGEASLLDEGFHLSNGLGFSPDGKTLYATDSAARTIYRYDYDIVVGAVSNRRILVTVSRNEGLPDGLCVDADGFVWSAQWYGSCIVRYDPDGKLERRIDVPAKQTSSLCFGGPDLTDIFVTSAGISESTPLMPPGYDPFRGCIGGSLYRVNVGILGMPTQRANIALPQSPTTTPG